MRQRLKQIWSILGIVALFVIVKLLVPVFSLGGLKGFVAEAGVLGPIVIIFLYIITQVFAPLSGTPILVLSIALFGMWPSMLYIYMGELISSIINFYLSRRWGRDLVVKFVGKKTMKDIDEFVGVFGVKVMIIGRVFGFALFDVISYAAGLTNISFKKYYLVTIIFAIIPLIGFGLVFGRLDFNSYQGLIITFGALAAAGLIFAFLLKKYIKKMRINKI